MVDIIHPHLINMKSAFRTRPTDVLSETDYESSSFFPWLSCFYLWNSTAILDGRFHGMFLNTAIDMFTSGGASKERR